MSVEQWKQHFSKMIEGNIPNHNFYVISKNQTGAGDSKENLIKIVSPTENVVERAKSELTRKKAIKRKGDALSSHNEPVKRRRKTSKVKRGKRQSKTRKLATKKKEKKKGKKTKDRKRNNKVNTQKSKRRNYFLK